MIYIVNWIGRLVWWRKKSFFPSFREWFILQCNISILLYLISSEVYPWHWIPLCSVEDHVFYFCEDCIVILPLSLFISFFHSLSPKLCCSNGFIFLMTIKTKIQVETRIRNMDSSYNLVCQFKQFFSLSRMIFRILCMGYLLDD